MDRKDSKNLNTNQNHWILVTDKKHQSKQTVSSPSSSLAEQWEIITIKRNGQTKMY